MKLTIYYGKPEPIVAVGINQCRMLAFAEKYPGWHTFKQDRATKQALAGLCRKGCMQVSGDQFRFRYP